MPFCPASQNTASCVPAAHIGSVIAKSALAAHFPLAVKSCAPVVVAADRPRSYADILVAAHSFDADDRPLSTYEFVRARFLHIGGVYRQG